MVLSVYCISSQKGQNPSQQSKKFLLPPFTIVCNARFSILLPRIIKSQKNAFLHNKTRPRPLLWRAYKKFQDVFEGFNLSVEALF